VDVVDLGLVEVTFQGKTQRRHKVVLVWQIDEVMDNNQPFLCRRRYSNSLHEMASLRRDLASWRGRDFSEQELLGFDLETLIGVGCLLNVIHETKNGQVFANVNSIMKLPKNMTAPMPRDYVRVVDRPQGAQADGAEDGLAASDEEIPF